MGVEYESEVFFGAYVERSSDLGRRIEAFIEKAGGCTPVDTETPGVQVTSVGSWVTGKRWMVIQASGSAKYSGDEAPRALIEDSRWRPALAAFFMDIDYPPLPVGWHFASSER